MFSFFSWYHGVLGINARNLLYIKPFNPKKAIAFADDKLKTKAFLTARGIPAAKIYARIEDRDQLRAFDFSKLPNECVLKPNFGFGGEGIMILKGRNKHGQFKRGKEIITNAELIEHIEDILDGKFSLGGRRDTAFFEQTLVSHDCFTPFRPVGLPDIRIIVFNLVPVMAMLRIPTAVSDGKANLHLGGIGIGIDIAKGTTTHAAQYHHMISELPHGGIPSGHVIPYWDDILLICSRIQQITNIGYLAADIAIDQQMGPAVLEVNARAGLNVQIANLAPLQSRLERVKGLKVASPEKGVRMGQDLFGQKVKQAQDQLKKDERPVLGLKETIVISGAGSTFEEPCLITPEQDRTEFSAELLKELCEKNAVTIKNKKAGTYRVKFSLGGKKLQTLVGTASDLSGLERAVIGRRDLTEFLIDPTREKGEQFTTSAVKSDLRAVDKMLAQYDRDLLLLKYLKPTNLDAERQRLNEDAKYNPIFSYQEVGINLDEAERRLQEEVQDDSPLGILLEKKRQELLNRIVLLRARGDAESFTQASVALYGKATSSLIRAASASLHNRTACELPPPITEFLSAEKAKARFEAVLSRYSLHDWQVSIRLHLVADCTVGGNNVYLRDGAFFAPDHIEALIKHEIETHILIAENGDHQPYALFRRGCAGYLDTQEGLAIYNQNRIYSLLHEKRYNPPRNLLGVDFVLEHSFADTRQYLHEEIGYDIEKALTQTIAMKRGLGDTSEPGGFTKSVVYFRGLRSIEKFIDDDGDIRRLYIGRVALEDLSIVEEIADLQPPVLLPDFLREEQGN